MWSVKKSRIVPTTIRCIGTGPSGLLVAFSPTNPRRSPRNQGGDYIAINSDRTILSATEYPEVMIDNRYCTVSDTIAITSSGDDIYLTLRTWEYSFPNIINNGRIVPLGYDRIDESGRYVYNPKRGSMGNHMYNEQLDVWGNHYKYQGWYGYTLTVINNHLLSYRQSGTIVNEYDIVKRKQTYLPEGTMREYTYGGEYMSYESINIEVDTDIEKDGIVLKDVHIPNNIYKFTNGYGRSRSKVTGIAHTDNTILATFNHTYSSDECNSLVARYDMGDGSYIDACPVVRRINRNRVVHSNMDHMTGNGRLMVGIDTPRDTICIMDRNMNIINYFKPKKTLGGKSSLYNISKMIHIAIDHEDSIHLVTDDMNNVLTMDLEGRLLNVLESPRLMV